jgi:hypothetical protein
LSVTPYENLSTTEPTIVTVSGNGLEPNSSLTIRQVAMANVETEEFTGVLVEQLHKAVATTDSSGAFSVNVSVQYDVRTDLDFFDFCQNQPVSISLCYLHLQYQPDDGVGEVIGQPKLYFGVSAPGGSGEEDPGEGEDPGDSGVPLSKEACMQGGWQNYVDANGEPFKNQGACVSFVANGRN